MEKLQRFTPLISLALLALALAVVHHELKVYHWDEIRSVLTDIDTALLLKTLWLTAFSYLVLSCYDYLALEYAGEKLPFRCILLTSFLSYAFSNNIGHGWISGGSLRYRLYSGWGIAAASIARVILFCTITFALGVLSTLLLSYFSVTDHSLLNQVLPANIIQLTIVASLIVVCCWWLLVVVVRHRVTVFSIELSPPVIWLALRQSAVAILDVLLACSVLYIPLAQHVDLPFSQFLVLYVVSLLAGIISMIPGGVGVFEGSFLFLSSSYNLSHTHIIAALVIYRVVYYFIPLLLAGVTLAAYELRLHHVVRTPQVKPLVDVVESILPMIFSILLMLGGTVLLFSGATPELPERLKNLQYVLPLPLIEFSHLIGSVAGILLLLLARAVSQRLQTAYYVTLLVLGLGVVASLAKGWDFEEATVLSVMLLIMLPAKKLFYRKTGLVSLSFPSRWLFAVTLIVSLSIWLGFFSYKHVEYSNELWWKFSLHGDAPRFLRSIVAIVVIALAFLFYRFLTRPGKAPELPNADELDRISPLIKHSGDTMHFLALTGDKRILWSDSGKSCLMFDSTPRYWIAMGDPLGDAAEFEDLVWKFRELADQQGAQVAFYEVSRRHLSAYINLGMTLVKLGEEARIPLQQFSLEGKKRQSLRHAFNKAQREGFSFEIIPQELVVSVLPTLQAISDKWLSLKQGREKRFSVGSFDHHYLCRGAVAVIKLGEQIVAFANLWAPDNHEELSMDLMRYDPEQAPGAMEFLTVNLMLWGKAQGYQWFNVGMAPLSGMEQHPLAPLWQKVGNAIFRLSSDFYNFEGLYQYKNKFDPVWEPRYFAVPGNLHTAPALFAVTSLISGGIEGAIKK